MVQQTVSVREGESATQDSMREGTTEQTECEREFDGERDHDTRQGLMERESVGQQAVSVSVRYSAAQDIE
jgi:hypothetical protein